MIERGQYNEVHPSARVAQDAVISGWTYIGEGARIGSGTKLGNFVNVDKHCVIGKNCNLQVYVVLSMGTEVGDGTFFAGHASVADEKYPMAGPQIRKPAIIGRNVVVGMGALIIGGVKIGDNSVIAMGSCVTKDVPPNEVWMGSPAKFKMTRDEFDKKKADYEARIVGNI